MSTGRDPEVDAFGDRFDWRDVAAVIGSFTAKSFFVRFSLDS